ncbi:MAG: NTP transferase domain-containing protein [Desulfobulbaceae bacterium]|nr:NTP transferase domain-containing protein [Desulfobulbaceae bacterium]
MNNITAVILAAGKGTRMKSSRAKVLHEVFFRPMIHHVMDAVQAAQVDATAVVVGHQQNRVLEALQQYTFTPVIQQEQLGTGHAVLCAEEACAGADTVLILCGDTPLIRTETIDAMINHHQRMNSVLTLMTTLVSDPYGYGRIITNDNEQVTAIIEEKDADANQRRIKEINAGIYLVNREFLFETLGMVGTANSQGEVYLTDIVALADNDGHTVNRFPHADPVDVLGVNSRVELAQAHAELQRRRNTDLMLSGVTMYGPDTIYVAQGITVGPDTVIHPGVQITGRTTVGIGCIIESGAVLKNCAIGNNAIIGAWSVLQDATVQPSEFIFPRTVRPEEFPDDSPRPECRQPPTFE